MAGTKYANESMPGFREQRIEAQLDREEIEQAQQELAERYWLREK